jgi:GH25 family lysozyme M1 (1,4-beta-N-acetylmuramidase)
MTLWGIDISNHQPTTDLAKAKASGCGFVFAKATEGGTYRDAYFSGFRSKAASLGIPLGAYHFARPGSGRSGAQEADFFLSVVGDVRPGELPCVLDLEDTKLGASATVAWALDWLKRVHSRTGVRPILYTYSGFAQAHLAGGAALAAYPLWLANYRTSTALPPTAPAPWKSWHIWQHTSTARVPGVPGNCDRNITNLSTAQLKALAGAPTVQEDDMPLTKDDAVTLLTGSPVMKDVTAEDPNTAPRVAAGFLVELTAKNSVTIVGQLAGLTAAVKALAESKPGVDPAALLATVQKTVDAGVTAALADLSITLSNQGA